MPGVGIYRDPFCKDFYSFRNLVLAGTGSDRCDLLPDVFEKYQRFKENQTYLNLRFRVTEWAKGVKSGKWKEDLEEVKKYKIFKCPNCGQKIRIPRGHGKVSVHCRKCGHDFIGRT